MTVIKDPEREKRDEDFGREIRSLASRHDVDSLAAMPREQLEHRRAEASERIETRQDRALDQNRDLTNRESSLSKNDAAELAALEAALLLSERNEQRQRNVIEGMELANRSRSGGPRDPLTGKPLQVETRGLGEYGVPSFAHSDDEIARLYEAVATREPLRIESRATITLTQTGGEIAGMTDRLVTEPRRLVAAVGLPAEPVPIRGVSAPKYGLEAVAAATAEGQTKPEFDNILAQTLVPQCFARWTDVTEQGIEAMGGMAGLIAAHTRQIALDEDEAFINELETEAGTAIAFATDVQANVRKAIATVESTVAAPVDVIVVHPDNFGLLADTTPANGQDVASRVTTFSGALVYPSASMTTGFMLVAALRAVARYGVTGGLRTNSVPNLKTNVVTVRTEIFSDLAITIGGGVKTVDVVTP
jgi:hypothetical protein